MSSTRIRKSPTLVSTSTALRVLGLAAEHDQRAQALRVAERDAGHVEHDPGGGSASTSLTTAESWVTVSTSISPARRKTTSSGAR